MAFLLFAHASFAHAATLSFVPSATNVSVGNIVSVTVDVSADGTAVNTAGATIQFPTGLLQVVSVSKANSIFSLWVQDPAFSNGNGNGTVTFTGGLPTPGFSGQNGQVVSIVFIAKKSGTASLIMSDPSVLANDGLGTDVLTAYNSATIKIGGSGSVNASNPAAGASSAGPESLPVITSATDPDQDAWYSNSTASFSWKVPSNVILIQTQLNKTASAIPTNVYDPSVSERTVNDIADGISYFHVRYQNAAGWGPTATYKVQIDTTPPKPFGLDVQTHGSLNTVMLDATDAMSGVASYSVVVDDEPSLIVPADDLPSGGLYFLPVQNAGSHSLAITAYDKAGNHTESDATYTSPAVVAPTLAVSSSIVSRGDTVTITGHTPYPDSPIVIYVDPHGTTDTYMATTSVDGSYSLVTDPLSSAGIATIWSQLVFAEGVTSPISNKVTIEVRDGAIVAAGKSVIYGLSYLIPALAFLALLLFGLYLGWHKFFGVKKRLEKQTRAAVNDIHKSMVLFKEELESQLNKLEKLKDDRELNKKEEKIFKELKESVDSIEEFIEKKIKKIM